MNLPFYEPIPLPPYACIGIQSTHDIPWVPSNRMRVQMSACIFFFMRTHIFVLGLHYEGDKSMLFPKSELSPSAELPTPSLKKSTPHIINMTA